MELLEHLRRQFAYDAWANREACVAIKESASQNARAIQLLAHILSAERLWLERIRKQPQTFPCGRISHSPTAKHRSAISRSFGANILTSFLRTGSRRKSLTKTLRANHGRTQWKILRPTWCCTRHIIAGRSPARCAPAEIRPPILTSSTPRARVQSNRLESNMGRTVPLV
jgi:hypothetical protein